MEEIILEELVDQKFNLIRKNIRKYRKENDLTQKQLAYKIGYTEDYIAEIESLKKNKRFSVTIIILIAESLEIPLYRFFI